MSNARMAPASSSSEGESSGVESWIEWFCKQEGNEFLCEVDRRYIEDNFNLYGLREIIGVNFRKCLDIILDRQDSTTNETIEQQVQDLYGLIHARFIITKRGQDKMRRKMKDHDFGVCPRLQCQQQAVLPVGLKDHINVGSSSDSKTKIDTSGAMVYCPSCGEIFLPANRCGYRNDEVDLDGAYFGTTFPHLFMMQFPDLWPAAPVKVDTNVPRVFGFKVRLPSAARHSIGDNNTNMEGTMDTTMADGQGASVAHK